MIAYVGEIVACTEQYFRPIKHARKVLGTHRRYANFSEYGEADDFEAKLKKFCRACQAQLNQIAHPELPVGATARPLRQY